jgi:hypothetical protein
MASRIPRCDLTLIEEETIRNAYIDIAVAFEKKLFRVFASQPAHLRFHEDKDVPYLILRGHYIEPLNVRSA